MTKDDDVLSLHVENAYSLDNLKQLLKVEYTRDIKHVNGGKRTTEGIGDRDRVAFAWNHYMMIRGEAVTGATLSKLFPHTHATKDGARQFAFGLVLAIATGKTNQNHTIYSSIVRNKDVELCPVGAFALYMFGRWMVSC